MTRSLPWCSSLARCHFPRNFLLFKLCPFMVFKSKGINHYPSPCAMMWHTCMLVMHCLLFSSCKTIFTWTLGIFSVSQTDPSQAVRALVLVPTKELSQQAYRNIKVQYGRGQLYTLQVGPLFLQIQTKFNSIKVIRSWILFALQNKYTCSFVIYWLQ